MIGRVTRILRTPPGWFTLAFALALLAYHGWQDISGRRKLAEAGLAAAQGPQNVEIVLAIEPEQFHLVRLQAVGRLIRFENRRAFVMDARPDALQGLARNSWVAAVKPWSGA
jgi:hypothetical protein